MVDRQQILKNFQPTMGAFQILKTIKKKGKVKTDDL